MSGPDIGKPLLDYAIISEPYPLYAAVGTGTPSATVHLVVSNGGGETVYCREIVFSLPQGDLAQSLVNADLGDGSASADGWTVERIEAGADIALPDGDYANFVARADGGSGPLDVSGLTITLTNLSISSQPGTARVEVRETATLDQGEWPDSPGFTTLAITKFPAPRIPVQSVGDFHADGPEASCGGNVRLTWRGPDTLEYTVLHGSGAKPAYGQSETTTDQQWKGTILRDTTFHLSYVLGDTTHYLTTTITVPDPELTALTVDGDVAARSALTVSGDVTARSALTVSGNVAAWSALTVSGDVAARSALTVSGNVTAQSTLNVNGSLYANHDFTAGYGGQNKLTTSGLNGLKVLGDLTVGGSLTGTGGVEFTTSGKIVRIRELRGPYGEDLTINSTVRVLEQCGFTIAGHTVLRDGDSIGLQNNQKSGWLYAPAYDYDGDRGYIFRWKPGNRVGGDSWRVTRD